MPPAASRAATTRTSFPRRERRAFLELGMRCDAGAHRSSIFRLPTRRTPMATSRAGLATRDACEQSRRCRVSLAPHAPYTVSDATGRRSSCSRDSSICRCRYAISPKPRAGGESAQPLRARHPAAHALSGLGVTGPRAHRRSRRAPFPEDIALLAAHGSHVAHCPVSNMKLGAASRRWRRSSRAASMRRLGTDGAASNNRARSFRRDAHCRAARESGDRRPFGAARAAGTSGCHALRCARPRLEERIGSLVAGRRA